MSAPINWINRGREGCTGNVVITREADGTLLRNTCDSCPLEWTVPVLTERAGAHLALVTT